MSKQEYTLAFVLSSLKKDIQRIDLNNLLAFISANIVHENSFDFVMSNSGIFSYELENTIKRFKEKRILNANGIVSIENIDEISSRAQRVSVDDQMNILKLIKEFYTNPQDSLSKIADLYTQSAKHAQKNTIFTAGYEGVSVDSFILRILNAGIKNIVDVRCNPISRKFGFSKGQLSGICESVNLAYSHIPTLGIPSESRKSLTCKNDYQVLFAEYERTILENTNQEQESLIEVAYAAPTVLICFEADKNMCHRTRLAKRISKKSGMKIMDI